MERMEHLSCEGRLRWALQPGEEKAPEGPDCGVSGLKGKYSLGNTGRGFPERQWMPHPWKHSSQAHSRMGL